MSAFLMSLALAAPLSSLPSRPNVEAPTQTVQIPASAETLRSLLSAHHVTDLPSPAVVDAHGGAPALTWLADNDPSVRIRVRALDLLTTRADAPSADVCLRAVESNVSGAIQAAGLRCLSRTEQPAADVITRVQHALLSQDPRVSREAVRTAAALQIQVPE